MPEAVYLERGVSALKSDATIHLGNFFGTLKGSLEGQDVYARNNFLFLADRHYLIDFDADVDFKGRNHGLVCDFIALGFNPERTVIYRQSDIRELFSVMWILSCSTPAKELFERKDFRADIDPSLARVLYPQLMAADILGLRATRVYVGPDEIDHVNHCQEIAGFVNAEAERVLLPLPKRAGVNSGDMIPGLDGKSMSATNRNIIPIFGNEKAIHRNFQQIPVAKVRRREPINPDTDICFSLFQLMARPEAVADVRAKYLSADIDQEDARNLVEKQFYDFFAQTRERRKNQVLSEVDVEEILQNGQQRVRREMRNTIAILEDVLYYNIGIKSLRS